MLDNSNSFVSSDQNGGAKDLLISSFRGLAPQHSAPCILAHKAKYLSLHNIKINIDHLEKCLLCLYWIDASANTKGGSITVPLTSCLTGLESAV